MALEAALLPVPELHRLARDIRARVIKTSHLTQTPHLGSCLSCVDNLVSAYRIPNAEELADALRELEVAS